jgi:hypothetical protein
MEPKKRTVKLAVVLLCMTAIGGWYITSGIAEETNSNINTNANSNTTTINQFPDEGMQVNPIVHLGGYGALADPVARHRTDEAIEENYRLLVLIDKKIDTVNARLARIEKALNLKPIKSATIHGQKQSLRYGTN